jgi:hypothetical protein
LPFFAFFDVPFPSASAPLAAFLASFRGFLASAFGLAVVSFPEVRY